MEKKVKIPKRVAGLTTQRFTRLQEWVELAKVKPKYTERPVVLFSLDLNRRYFPGLPITVSSADYARTSALNTGYTHWTDVPWPYPAKTKRELAKRGR